MLGLDAVACTRRPSLLQRNQECPRQLGPPTAVPSIAISFFFCSVILGRTSGAGAARSRTGGREEVRRRSGAIGTTWAKLICTSSIWCGVMALLSLVFSERGIRGPPAAMSCRRCFVSCVSTPRAARRSAMSDRIGNAAERTTLPATAEPGPRAALPGCRPAFISAPIFCMLPIDKEHDDEHSAQRPPARAIASGATSSLSMPSPPCRLEATKEGTDALQDDDQHAQPQLPDRPGLAGASRKVVTTASRPATPCCTRIWPRSGRRSGPSIDGTSTGAGNRQTEQSLDETDHFQFIGGDPGAMTRATSCCTWSITRPTRSWMDRRDILPGAGPQSDDGSAGLSQEPHAWLR